MVLTLHQYQKVLSIWRIGLVIKKTSDYVHGPQEVRSFHLGLSLSHHINLMRSISCKNNPNRFCCIPTIWSPFISGIRNRMLMEHHMEQQIKNLIGRKNVFSGMLHTFLNDQVPAPIVLFYLKLQVQLSLLHPFIFVLAMKSNLSPECLAQSICSRIVKFPIRWFGW